MNDIAAGIGRFERKLLSIEHVEIKIDAAVKGSFEGYGAAFGNVDQGKDILHGDSFNDTVAQHEKRGTVPHMLFNHDSSEPVGDWNSMKPDKRGLKMAGQVWVDSGIPKAEQTHKMLQSKTMKGLSIGYVTKKASYDEKTGVRTLLACDLKEVSAVLYPMNQKAVITSVKSLLDEKQSLTIREAEEFLRDALNMSGSEAKAFLAKLKAGFESDARDEQRADLTKSADIAEAIKNLNKALRG